MGTMDMPQRLKIMEFFDWGAGHTTPFPLENQDSLFLIAQKSILQTLELVAVTS